jgi:hypothetical protein
MIDLHVYPQLHFHKNRGQPGELHLRCGQSAMGHRAKMLYIHGPADQWADPPAQQWLQKSAMTRLMDNNPARVVWSG